MNKGLFVFLAALSTFSEAGLITYQYDVTLDDTFGSLAAGTVLTGEFSFESEQSGTDIPYISNAKRFELSALSLSHGSESIEMNITSDNDGWIVVGDDSPPPAGIDFFSVRAEGPVIPAFTGTLGGLAVHSLFLSWQDMDGTANDVFSLPLNEPTFDAYESATGQLQGAIGGDESTITIVNVSAIPLPPAIWLFGSGLLGLIGVTRRKKAA